MLPTKVQGDYAPLLSPFDPEVVQLVKAADKLWGYFKAVREVAAGDREFAPAERAL